MRLAIPVDFILIWHLKDIMLSRIHITTEIFCLTEKKHPLQKPGVPSPILSRNLWHNQYIQTEMEPVYLVKLSNKNINTVSQL